MNHNRVIKVSVFTVIICVFGLWLTACSASAASWKPQPVHCKVFSVETGKDFNLDGVISWAEYHTTKTTSRCNGKIVVTYS